MDDVVAAVDSKQPGDEIELTVVRAGEERDVTVELADRPEARTGLGTRTRPSSRPYPCGRDEGQVLRHHQARGRREAVRLGAWAIGLNHRSGSPRRCDPATAAAIGAALRRSVRGGGRFRQPEPRRGRRRGRGRAADDGPAPRRRGAGVLRRGRAPHRGEGDQGAPGPQRRRHPGRRGLPHRLPPLDAHRPGTPGGTGESFDWELARAHAPEVPVILAGGLTPGQRRRGDRGRAPVRRRRRQRGRVRARRQGPRADGGVRRARPGAGRRRRPGRTVSGPAGAAGGVGATVGIEERFGPYGGRFVPETLVAALDELTVAWAEARDDPASGLSSTALLRDFVGRPTPLYLAERLSERLGRRVYLKREDLAHTGAHKINNAVGQALLAKRMGKPRVIAETGRRPARRGDRHRLRAARPRVRRVHGHRGHAPPGAERRADAAAGRGGGAGRGRRADAEGGGQRRDPRLGHQRRRTRTTSSARRSARRRTRRSCATSSG